MARTKQKSSLSISRWLLLSGAALLVLIGAAGGVALDVALRPVHRAPVRAAAVAPHPSQRAVPPVIRVPADEQTSPSIIAPRPEAPETAASAPHAAEQPAQTEPMIAFAVPSKALRTHPALAIVIDDMGLDRVHSLKALTLGGPLTISIMTYAEDAAGLAARAHAAGDEVLAHVPMQPLDPRQDPGPHALTVAMDDAAIHAALAADLDRWHGYVGINNHMGSRFTQDRARMAVVMEELKARGLLWLDSRTTTNSAGGTAAEAAGVPFVERDVFLDDIDSAGAIQQQLESAIAFAKAHGTAIAIGHPREATIAVLERVLPTLEERGVSLVPVTEVLKRREEGRKSKPARAGPA